MANKKKNNINKNSKEDKSTLKKAKGNLLNSKEVKSTLKNILNSKADKSTLKIDDLENRESIGIIRDNITGEEKEIYLPTPEELKKAKENILNSKEDKRINLSPEEYYKQKSKKQEKEEVKINKNITSFYTSKGKKQVKEIEKEEAEGITTEEIMSYYEEKYK